MNLNLNDSIRSVASTGDLIIVSATEKVPEAWKLMKTHGVRHLPVSWENEIIGIITPRDTMRALRLKSRFKEWSQINAFDFESDFRVCDVMSTPAAFVSTNVTLSEAAKQMTDQKLSALLLTHADGRLAGIVTSYDLLVIMAQSLRSDSAILSERGRHLFEKFPLKQLIDEASLSGI